MALTRNSAKRFGRCLAALAALIGGSSLPACQEDGGFSLSVFDPLGVTKMVGLVVEPVRIGITVPQNDAEMVTEQVNWGDTRPWYPLQKDLRQQLGKPIQCEMLEMFQVEFHLQGGRLQFALIPAADYEHAYQEGAKTMIVLARSVADETPRQRRGAIVASSSSKIQSIEDIKGRRFSFGPKGDPILYQGAVDVLEKQGVKLEDISRELLPVVGPLQHHISSYESGKAVATREFGVEVGVMDESDYESLPDSGGSLFPVRLAKDQFRVLGYTESLALPTLPAGVVVASEKTDPALVEKMKNYLLQITPDRPDVMKALGYSRFEEYKK